jgi:hypothetical protein
MAKPAATPKKPTTQNVQRVTKGDWDFSVSDEDLVDEVPVVAKTNVAARLPFDWDAYAAQDKVVKKFVPVEFWINGRGYTAENATPGQNRDRIKRAFWGWRDQAGKKDERRAEYSVTITDQYDPKDPKKYLGLTFYFMAKSVTDKLAKAAAKKAA